MLELEELFAPSFIVVKKSMIIVNLGGGGAPDQGGIKFEISWEPYFPVNDFARNNGKDCFIFLAVNRKIILFTRNIKNILIFFSRM